MELHQQQMQWVCELQLRDADLEAMIAYLKKEQLPKEEKAAKKLILESRSYEMVEGVWITMNILQALQSGAW